MISDGDYPSPFFWVQKEFVSGMLLMFCIQKVLIKQRDASRATLKRLHTNVGFLFLFAHKGFLHAKTKCTFLNWLQKQENKWLQET